MRGLERILTGENKISRNYVRSFFGICHSGWFDLYGSLGASWCRVDFSWSRIEPTQGRFEFTAYDKLVEEGMKHGVTILPILDYCAPWASRGDSKAYPPRDPSYWVNYVDKVVSRYSSPPYNLKYFEVWNEPNIDVFWRLDWERYIDDILIPAAEVIHSYGCYVVAPSVTLEHLGESTFTYEFLRRWNLNACIDRIDEWLSYHDAWKYLDIVSIHYSKGDTESERGGGSKSLMAFYDHVYEKWIKPGRVMGLWNTEEGLTAVYDEDHRQVSLEPWEIKPYGQWVARYIIPVLHWALNHDWRFRDQYKLFWYHISDGDVDKPLYNTCIIGVDGNLTEVGKAYRVIAKNLFDGNIGIPEWRVEVKGAEGPLKSYCFLKDDDLLIAGWTGKPTSIVKVKVYGVNGEFRKAESIDYLSGRCVNVKTSVVNGNLEVETETSGKPVVYIRLYRG
ncbi:hypothetical protein DRO37_07390 [Candidatus Bathyarchaeota archaeon]|nr:MAG: hypothetical protein DRO37_07390 [Candidatus Bathyarchaeota archaeon]